MIMSDDEIMGYIKYITNIIVDLDYIAPPPSPIMIRVKLYLIIPYDTLNEAFVLLKSQIKLYLVFNLHAI